MSNINDIFEPANIITMIIAIVFIIIFVVIAKTLIYLIGEIDIKVKGKKAARRDININNVITASQRLNDLCVNDDEGSYIYHHMPEIKDYKETFRSKEYDKWDLDDAVKKTAIADYKTLIEYAATITDHHYVIPWNKMDEILPPWIVFPWYSWNYCELFGDSATDYAMDVDDYLREQPEEKRREYIEKYPLPEYFLKNNGQNYAMEMLNETYEKYSRPGL